MNMHIKFILTVILIAFFSIQGRAQFSKLKISLEAGVNYSSSSEETAPLKKTSPILPRIGITADYDISQNFFLESGLLYAMKGLRSEGETGYDNMKIHAKIILNQHLLQFPLLIGRKFEIKKRLIKLSAGGYISYGIGGETKAIGDINDNPLNKELKTFGNGNLLNRVDCGILFKVESFAVNNFFVTLSYELGLINVGNMNIMGGELNYKNRCSVLTIGYQIK